MHKINLIAFLSIFCLSASAQDFSISTSIADSIGLNEFRYKPEGSVILESGTELIVELYDPLQSNLLFTGSYSFDNPSSSTIPGFLYNDSEKRYSMDLGNYNSNQNILKMWTVKNGTIINQLMYQE
jgi:hypothetical protein